MVRIFRIALVGAFLLAAACGSDRGQDADVVLATSPAALSAIPGEPSPEVDATLEPSLTPTTTPTSESDESTTLVGIGDLAAHFADAAALLDGASARIGVAVLEPDGRIYVGGDHGKFTLASVVKVPVMIATLERARLDGRPVSSEEENLLRLMVASSSNSATDVLWRSLGGAIGISELIEPLGVTGIEFAADGQWGDSEATALDMALLLELLVDENSALTEDMRHQALELMESVVADQRWGASAGVDLSAGGDATLAIKNGWYPEVGGWLLNSAGVITVSDSSGQDSAHVIVVLTEGAPNQTEGVRTIEEIAAAINHAIVPPALAIVPPLRSFATTPLPTDEEPVEAEPGGSGEVEAGGVAVTEPEPSVPALVAFGGSRDVLIPAAGRFVGSKVEQSELTLWYELPAAAADEMLRTYAGSMLKLGWSEVVGPPSVVLNKDSEARWVGLSTYTAGTGERLVELRISPAPGVVSATASLR